MKTKRKPLIDWDQKNREEWDLVQELYSLAGSSYTKAFIDWIPNTWNVIERKLALEYEIRIQTDAEVA
jgi:hypothetical protein